ncbi:Facilitated trehalose transporter Tret1 [Portunus trituberculatus]|uniref:Facilitated trehalose transporter Tret1 n=1 Tax=Portunus trituberculatus TaxID=210409 RepID=A0A5B7FWY3_PORTR|nr:Facilitated trehalose transporter Tret1 [Portunus trituberculatus]
MQVTKPARAVPHQGMGKRAAQNANHHCPEQNITPAHTSSLNSQITSPSSTMSRKSGKKPPSAKFVYVTPPAPQHCTQVLATMVVSLGPLCAGLGKGYSSPALASMAMLSAQGHHFSISEDQGSWIASLSLLGAFFGAVPGGMAIRFGRKRVLCAISIPFALSWLMTVVAWNVNMLYVAALTGGVCSAVIAVVTPVYISEIAHPEIRGCLCALSKLSGNIGMLLSYLLGAFLDWRELATVTAVAPICLFIAALFIPETPSFLLYRGRDTEAADALRWLRGSEVDVARELTTMKANIATLRRETESCPERLAPRELLRPLFITCGLMVFQKFSGANAFNFYAVPILDKTFVGLNPYRAAVVVAFVQICAGMASSALIDTVGRRPLLVFSNMLMSAALAAFGGYTYLKGLDQDENLFVRQQWRDSDWVPLFCILIIEIAFALGVSPISWLYIGELFPLKHRGVGSFAASVSYACSFVSVKTFVDLEFLLGLYGAFWLYSSVAAIALVFTLLFVPETKGKTRPPTNAAATAHRPLGDASWTAALQGNPPVSPAVRSPEPRVRGTAHVFLLLVVRHPPAVPQCASLQGRSHARGRPHTPCDIPTPAPINTQNCARPLSLAGADPLPAVC